MPELPDLTVYLEALEQRLVGQTLERVRLLSPFLLRTALPPIESVHGRRVTEVRRLGKRLAIGLEGDLWLVFHQMIAGRLNWIDKGAPAAKRAAHARHHFACGTLTQTEDGRKRPDSQRLRSGA
jgi:formamidopyrimidine-DNA glycosylase